MLPIRWSDWKIKLDMVTLIIVLSTFKAFEIGPFDIRIRTLIARFRTHYKVYSLDFNSVVDITVDFYV